jgi:hypothetical protein
MPDDKSQKFSLGGIRILFLSCFGALLFLEIALAAVALRYNQIQDNILKDQSRLLRARELLNDALGDSKRIWNPTLDGSVTTQQDPPSLPASATQATKATALLQKLARPSLAFPSGDVDRLDDTLSNNSKLLSAPTPYSTEQKNLIEKTIGRLSAFVSAIDIRLFSAMQELRREVEFLQMITWGLLPLLIVCTAIFGFLLQARVMQPLQHLKKQSRKLTDSIVTLQKELRVFELEKKDSSQVAKQEPSLQVDPEFNSLASPVGNDPGIQQT